jgi:hypothetical protein
MDFTNLPPEIIHQFVSYLDKPTDYCNAQKASRIFDTLTSRSKFLKMNLRKTLEYAAFIDDKELYDLIRINRSSDTADELKPYDIQLMLNIFPDYIERGDGTISYGFDCVKYFKNRAGPICIAAYNGYLDMIRHIRITDELLFQQTKMFALDMASKSGNLDIVKYFIEDGITGKDGIVQEFDWKNILSFACQFGHLGIVKYIHQLFGSILKDMYFDPLLWDVCIEYACEGGALDILKYLENNVGLRPNNRYIESACTFGKLNIVTYLWSLGFRFDPNRYHTFYEVVRCGDNFIDIVKFIIEHQIDIINIYYEDYRMNIMSLIENNDLDMIKYLHSVRPLVNIGNSLQIAITQNYLEMVKFLISCGFPASYSKQSYNDLSPEMINLISRHQPKPLEFTLKPLIRELERLKIPMYDG